jgi:hypothetical protein
MKAIKYLFIGILMILSIASVGLSLDLSYGRIIEHQLDQVWQDNKLEQKWRTDLLDETGMVVDHIVRSYDEEAVSVRSDFILSVGMYHIKIYGLKNGKKVHMFVDKKMMIVLDKKTHQLVDRHLAYQEETGVEEGW